MIRTSRRLKLALIIGVGLVVAGGAFLWALPEVVRRVALDEIPKRTGRPVTIEDVDLNLFTGHLAIKQFRLADREGREPFIEVERLDIRLAPLALLRAHVLVRELVLTSPTIRVVRTGPAEFNFSDLLATREPEPAATKGRWVVTVERLSLTHGRVQADDRAVSPRAEWLVHDLEIEATGITTRGGAAPGRLTVGAKLNEAVLSASADPLRLEPPQLRATLSLDGFDTRRLDPYLFVSRGTPYRPSGGRLGFALKSTLDSDTEGIRKLALSGTATLEGGAFTEVGRRDPFVSASRVSMEVKEADALARTLTVAWVNVEGLDLKARRDVRGVIDLLDIFTPKAPPAAAAANGSPLATPAPPSAAPPPRTLFPVIRALAGGLDQIRVDRITLSPSTATFIDEAVKPTATLALSKLEARLDDLTWPVRGPATVRVSAGLPGGGTLEVRGPVIVQPLDAELTIAVRNAPVEPYQAYIPIPARLSGRFNGDSTNHIALRHGTLVAASKGNSWAQNVEIRGPGAARPAIRVERMELMGIDFDWPKHATALKAAFRRPRVEVEREADGSINLRRLFTAPGSEATTPTPEPAPNPGGPPTGRRTPNGVLETMRLEFREVRIDDGFIRFVDRTTTPAFSEDLSRLEVRLTDLGNGPREHARLALQSVVGGDADLDLQGTIGALGSAPFIDLVGELRRFQLPSVDPYAAANIGWIIKRGELQYKLRFKLDGTELSADNDVVVAHLQVAPTSGGDEVKRRIGLPLGLIVALIKDQHGDIHATVPVAGTVNDPKFDLRETIWTAIKNVLVNIVTAPFKAIGRLFSGGDKSSGDKLEEPKVDPVTFAAGSAVLSPPMEDHLVRVADFLRRSPFLNLALTPVPTRADAEALTNEAVTARLGAFQKEHGLDDAAAARAEYYKAYLPDVPLPATVDEQLALLREREPAPADGLAELSQRRLAATRERLVDREGIPETRLTTEEPPQVSPTPSGEGANEGRVEFGIVSGGD